MKKGISILLVLLMAFSLTACSAESSRKIIDNSGIALVIIAGRHGNARWEDKNLDIAKELMLRAFQYEEKDGNWYATSNISVIVNDGKPEKVSFVVTSDKASVDLNIIEGSGRNEKAITSQVAGAVDLLIEAMSNKGLKIKDNTLFTLRADDPEADLLGAISEAQIILNNNKYKNATEKHILIIDSGISTAGTFNMCNISLVRKTYDEVSTAEDVISRIPTTGFPDLNGIKVTFLGLGNVADPQMSINRDNELKTMLENIWTKIIEDKCHGKLTEKIRFSEITGLPMEWNADGSGDYPLVTPVDFTRPLIQTSTRDSSNSETPTSEPFTSTKLGFIADEPNFSDREATIKVLSSRAIAMKEYLRNNPGKKVFVIGSIAKTERGKNYEYPSPEYPPYLSQSRANAVADILINEYGIPKSSLVVIGAGVIEFSWRNANEFGWRKKFDEEAPKNRVVNIFKETHNGSCTSERDELVKQKKKSVLENLLLSEVLQRAGDPVD